MRTFIAIDIPPEIKERVATLCASLAPLRCIDPGSLHLTLRFCGEMDREAVNRLDSLLARIESPPFTLSVAGTGAFPAPARPRVLWVGIGGGPEILDLQHRVEAACRETGLPPEEKRFSPHLTIARLKAPPTPEVRRFLKESSFVGGTFTVTGFHRYSSTLTPRGAVHARERSYPLS